MDRNRIQTLRRLNKLAIVAATLYGLMDFLWSWNPVAAAPYWLHRHEPVFRSSPQLFLGVIAEAINGWIAALSFVLIEPSLGGPSWRRGALFGLMIWGFWVISGTLSAHVWLDIPSSLSVVNVIFGLPKCLVIGCGVAWFFDHKR